MKILPIKSGTRMHFCHLYLIHYWKPLSQQSDKKKIPKFFPKEKSVTIHRWFDTLYRKPWSLHPKTIRLINEFSKVTGWVSEWVKSLSPVRLFATPWTVAYQAPLSLGFSRQEYWSGLPFPSPGNLPDPGIEPGSPALQADALTSEPPGKPQGSPKSYRIQN